MATRRPVLAVIGPGRGDGPERDVPPSLLEAAREVGRLAVEAGFRVATGGLGGVMEAASEGAREATSYREGDVVGIVKGHDHAEANDFVDIVIPTGLGLARNLVLVSTADVVVALAGGSGTLSELALAWQLGRPVVALEGDGWAGRLAGEAIDGRRENRVESARDPAAAITKARALIGP